MVGQSNKQKARNFSCVVPAPPPHLENTGAFVLVSVIFELSKNVLMVNPVKNWYNMLIS